MLFRSRWHISLSNWFRDYLYLSLGGNRRGAVRGYANLAIVFLLCGLWHGASWPFVIWGAWHGLFLIAERAGLDHVLARIGRLRHLYTMAVVMGGWVLFRCDAFSHALEYYAALFGQAVGSPARQPFVLYFDALLATTLALSVFGAGPLARRVGVWRDAIAMRGGTLRAAVLTADVAWLALVFITASTFLASGTYNPFIYFRF